MFIIKALHKKNDWIKASSRVFCYIRMLYVDKS